jgi:hypothetical protein
MWHSLGLAHFGSTQNLTGKVKSRVMGRIRSQQLHLPLLWICHLDNAWWWTKRHLCRSIHSLFPHEAILTKQANTNGALDFFLVYLLHLLSPDQVSNLRCQIPCSEAHALQIQTAHPTRTNGGSRDRTTGPPRHQPHGPTVPCTEKTGKESLSTRAHTSC